MSRVTHFVGYTFVCPYCGKRLKANTTIVLEHEIREHTPGCFKAAKKRTQQQLAADAQLELTLAAGKGAL
jgi:hypothetical protein